VGSAGKIEVVAMEMSLGVGNRLSIAGEVFWQVSFLIN
jgi:hypothetical protein